MAWNLYSYLGINWEFLATKHYFANRYYGGYSHSVLQLDGANYSIMMESFPCLPYVASSLTTNHEDYVFSLNVDRLYNCGLLPSLVVRLALGHIQLQTSIVIVNLLMWVASIALTYGIVQAWSKSRTAALIGAVIAAGHPVYGLLFESWKLQNGGATLLLAWIYVDKAIWPRLSWFERALLLDLTLTATMLASGAAYYILVYILAWSLYRALFNPAERREACLTIFVALCAFVIARTANKALMGHYQLMSTVSIYHLDKILLDSLEYLRVAISGGDTSSLNFLNFPGFYFVTSLLPWFVASCIKANPVIIFVPLIGMFYIRELRPLLLVVPALFVIGHSHVVLTKFHWYYSYSSAPAVQLMIVASAICLGQLLDSGLATRRALSAITLLIAVYWFNASPAFNIKNLFTEDAVYPIDRRLYVYHDDNLIRYW